jgi:hypothetical protein
MPRASASFALIGVLAILPSVAARAADESPTSEAARRAAAARKKLAAPINFDGIDDPETKLEGALQLLLGRNGLSFEVNVQAFKDESVDDVLGKPLGRAIPKMTNVTLERVLRRVLDRIPTSTGATFVVRGGAVEITTRRYAWPASWGLARGPLPPHVSIAFDKRELQEALQEIADATGVNIVLDAGCKDRAKTPVTVTLRDVHTDTAVRVLASMADLLMVPYDDVLCVTTKEKAKVLRKEQESKRRAEAVYAEENPGFLSGPPGVRADTVLLLKEREEEIRRLKEKIRRLRQPEPKKDE